MKVVPFPTPERDRLIESCIHLVEVAARSIARNLPPSFEIDDLIQEGYLGLIAAADSYDPAKGPFESRARFMVNMAIIDSVRRKNYVANTMLSIGNTFTAEKQINADASGDHTGGSFNRLPVSEQWQSSHDTEDALIDEIDERRKREQLADVIDGLQPRLRVVLAVHYQRHGQIVDAAAVLGVDPSRASQIHHEGLRELSQAFRRRGVTVHYSDLRAAVVNTRAA